MTDAGRRAELLEQAEALAGELLEANVKRNELTAAINGLFYSRGSWEDRRRRGRMLAEGLPGLWMKHRGGGVPARLEKVRTAVTRVLDEDRPEAELRYLFGWTLRLMRIRGR
jgi:hypothetical protein